MNNIKKNYSKKFSTLKGRSNSRRGRGKKKNVLPPSQKTLFEFVKKEKNDLSCQTISEETSCAQDEENSYQEDGFISAENKLNDLVKAHQLHEIINFFQMADQLQLQFTENQLKRLYSSMQQEIIQEFGVPLSPSLFPDCIFTETPQNSSYGSLHMNNSQNPRFNY